MSWAAAGYYSELSPVAPEDLEDIPFQIQSTHKRIASQAVAEVTK